jgi:hypothetical protein
MVPEAQPMDQGSSTPTPTPPPPPAAPRKKRTGLKLGIFLLAAIAIFLGGYIPPSLTARRADEALQVAKARQAEAEGQLGAVQFDLQVARLRGTLGEILQETNLNNFGNAAKRSTEFFDGIRAAASNPLVKVGSKRAQVFEYLLTHRDEISADLARADQAVKAKLSDMYMRYGEAVAP